jgi:hypothetical protein
MAKAPVLGQGHLGLRVTDCQLLPDTGIMILTCITRSDLEQALKGAQQLQTYGFAQLVTQRLQGAFVLIPAPQDLQNALYGRIYALARRIQAVHGERKPVCFVVHISMLCWLSTHHVNNAKGRWLRQPAPRHERCIYASSRMPS